MQGRWGEVGGQVILSVWRFIINSSKLIRGMSVQADRVVTVPPPRRINEVSQLEQVQPHIAGPALLIISLHITINHLTQTNNYIHSRSNITIPTLPRVGESKNIAVKGLVVSICFNVGAGSLDVVTITISHNITDYRTDLNKL